MVKNSGSAFEFSLRGPNALSRKMVVAVILSVALIAFEIFNFDTTQYALTNLLGEVRFAGVLWASILAIAFCAIDFAGLVRIFTPQKGREEPRAVLFLTGAWFLGTIANSIMTWWAVSLTLLSHDFGNEVLSREMLLRYVPIFVAMLVWLTRILFIGAFSVTGEEMFDMARGRSEADRAPAPARPETAAPLPARAASNRQTAAVASGPAAPAQPAARTTAAKPAAANAAPSRPPVTYEPVDDPFDDLPVAPKTNGGNGAARPNSRIQQRPPMPGGMNRATTGNMQARSPNNRS
ncbi:conserved membrane protein of unknown function [Candidatus Promineifilum breve]|uniref:Uncharacterized protein n=1 Tax=Candidatus Promineifilum breve TaxID=1806508 RepID=A0A170PEP8_9CHLR|nr:hypothetical protein [Candidatus Promineifilum breve]CUS02713.2 conserved membrane protein of unknown function [Candidatus Promineifilum breve]